MSREKLYNSLQSPVVGGIILPLSVPLNWYLGTLTRNKPDTTQKAAIQIVEVVISVLQIVVAMLSVAHMSKSASVSITSPRS